MKGRMEGGESEAVGVVMLHFTLSVMGTLGSSRSDMIWFIL